MEAEYSGTDTGPASLRLGPALPHSVTHTPVSCVLPLHHQHITQQQSSTTTSTQQQSSTTTSTHNNKSSSHQQQLSNKYTPILLCHSLFTSNNTTTIININNNTLTTQLSKSTATQQQQQSSTNACNNVFANSLQLNRLKNNNCYSLVVYQDHKVYDFIKFLFIARKTIKSSLQT